MCKSVQNFENILASQTRGNVHQSFSFPFFLSFKAEVNFSRIFVLLSPSFLGFGMLYNSSSHGGQKWTSFNILGIFFCNVAASLASFWFIDFILVRKSWHAHLIISNDVVFLRKIKYEFCENLLTFFHTKIFIVNLSFHLLI